MEDSGVNELFELFEQRVSEFFYENGNEYILRERLSDGSVKDHIFLSVKQTTTLDRSLSKATNFYIPGANEEEYVRFLIEADKCNFLPKKEDIVFNVYKKNGVIAKPIKVLEVYSVSKVDTIEFSNRVLFLQLYCNREELGKWNRLM